MADKMVMIGFFIRFFFLVAEVSGLRRKNNVVLLHLLMLSYSISAADIGVPPLLYCYEAAWVYASQQVALDGCAVGGKLVYIAVGGVGSRVGRV